jgi:hypothetical protein
MRSAKRIDVLLAAALCGALGFGCVLMRPDLERPRGAPADVLPAHDNRAVTALVEDGESVRLALGAAWDDALACRAFSGYLRGWGEADAQADAERMAKRGTMLFERVSSVDHGIQSVRLERDSRDAVRLAADVAFWRNELALAAGRVMAYADEAAALKQTLHGRLLTAAAARGISASPIEGMPWADPEREAWRRQGPATGVRLPLDPHPQSLAAWWNENLSVTPGYIVGKLASVGDAFFTPELPVGAWGYNCIGAGKYNWTGFNAIVERVAQHGGKLLLELPTLTPRRSTEQVAEMVGNWRKRGNWIWDLYAPALPSYLTNNPAASLAVRSADGTLVPHGAVQLLNPDMARAYGAYLMALAANLRDRGTYDAIAAIHLEQGDHAELPEAVDFSELTRQRWQAFMKGRHGDIAALNRAAGSAYASFADLPLPVRRSDPAAAGGSYPPVIAIDYLHFRRAWVAEYLAIKRGLVRAAFPDKLIIGEMRQMGDHDGVAGVPENIWGGFLADDWAQWSGTGPDNAARPFMIRSVGPVGFGTRLADSIESLYRDYLWIHFRNPGNLARYFYDWTTHGYLDYQMDWHGVTHHWLSNRLIYQLGGTVANTAPAPTRLGLVMPRATLDLHSGSTYYEVLGWDWLLQAAKLPYVRVDERLIRDGGLARLKLDLLILPGVEAMDDAVAAGLTAWVEQGGTLLASQVPGRTDLYGRPRARSALANLLGAEPDGSVSEPVAGTPLTVTIPRGIFSGMWAESTDRRPGFEALRPTTASVLERYEGGRPAIVVNRAGKGRAVTMGYPFGVEAVTADRTSVAFYRTYTCFAREPQLVARTAWLRAFLVDKLGYRPEFGAVEAEIERFKTLEARSLRLNVPQGFSQDTKDMFYVRTVGDPRPDHEIELARESPDMALRFFPRRREGVDTVYLGLSTREVHYIAPRGAVNLFLSRRVYRCRINNPAIRAIWDVPRDAPVGFQRDADGVTFDITLPSGHIGMLAYSETPQVRLFPASAAPGRSPADVLTRCRKLAGGRQPPATVNLTPGQIRPWLEMLAGPGGTNAPPPAPILISYGQEANRAAAETLAAFIGRTFPITVAVTNQAAVPGLGERGQDIRRWQDPLILIGDEWTNNDLAMHGGFWAENGGTFYGAHMPFTASYAWPGEGRAVVSLSRRHALIDEKGGLVTGYFTDQYRIRPVKPEYPLVRRKLHIAANAADARRAVEAILAEVGPKAGVSPQPNE